MRKKCYVRDDSTKSAASLLDALEYHRELRRRMIEWNKKHYSGLYLRKRKQPWYMITSGKQYNYEQRTEPYGEAVQYYRIKSQAAKAYEKTVNKKLTHEEYKKRLIQAKLNDWIRKNPCPIDTTSQQKDLFESEYLPKWNEAKEKMLKNICDIVENIGNKVFVYARYKGDDTYYRKIMEFKSDGRKLMILDGSYANHMWSKSIKRAQKRANLLGKDDNFVSLMVVDGNQKCILVPHKPLNIAA